MTSKQTNETKKETLPLDWTRVKRRSNNNKRFKLNNNNDDGIIGGIGYDDFQHCNDPNCLFENNNDDDPNDDKTCTIRNNSTILNTKRVINQNQNQQQRLKGRAIFCLHEIDCKWFQGYFLPSSPTSPGVVVVEQQPKSIGMLAMECSDTDECIQCANGGFRELDLTLLLNNNSSSNKNNNKKNKGQEHHVELKKLNCTGGDMLRIRSSRKRKISTLIDNSSSSSSSSLEDDWNVQFDAERIVTGTNVESIVKRYFSNLLDKATEQHEDEDHNDEDDDEDNDTTNITTTTSPTIVTNNEKVSPSTSMSVLDVLPECAIVIGSMSLTGPFPNDFFDNDNSTTPQITTPTTTADPDNKHKDNGTTYQKRNRVKSRVRNNNDDGDGWLSD